MSTTPPSQRQVMLSFAYMAYAGELITTPDPEPTILEYLNAAMPQIPPLAAPNDTWQIVWGPATYTMPHGKYQDNMMYVAQNQADTSQFVVAIRGTNFSSILDWLVDDFDVLTQVNWPPGATSGAEMISTSTSDDLAVLLGMTNANTTNGSPLTLLEYLKTMSESAINVCVTGHSLGGVLSSTLALYLYEQQAQWDQSGSSIVSCISFAGPTAGNAAFASYSDATFAAMTPPRGWDTSLGTNCDAVRCSLDVVPLGFVASNFTSGDIIPVCPILNWYDPGISSSSLSWKAWAEFEALNVSFGEAGKNLESLGYTQVVNTAAELTGTFQTPKPPMPASGATLDQFEAAFEQEAAYQHSSSYATILGVTELLDPNIIPRG